MHMCFDRITRILQFIAISLMFKNLSYASEPGYLELTRGELTITAGLDVPHGTNQEVTLVYSIKNHGLNIVTLEYIREPSPFEGFNTNHLDILDLRVWTPTGEPVLSFYDLPRKPPSGGPLSPVRLSISQIQIKPNEEVTRRVDLSQYFPLTQVGRYRCQFVRRVHVRDSTVIEKSSQEFDLRSMTPVQLDFPNLTFNIPKVDPSFTSPLASIAATDSVAQTSKTSQSTNVNDPPSTPSDEPRSSTSWSVIAILIIAASGLLWLALKRRS